MLLWSAGNCCPPFLPLSCCHHRLGLANPSSGVSGPTHPTYHLHHPLRISGRDADPAAVNAILSIVRHHLWLHRNRCRFDRLSPDASLVLRMAKSTFQFAVKLEHRHCLLTKYEDEWLLRGLIGTIANNNTISFSKDFMS